MSDIQVQAVQLKNSQKPFEPMRMPAWAPPGQQSLFDSKRMGQKKLVGSFSKEALPVSLSVGLGGAGAIIIGTKMPSPINAILIGGGLAALGFGIYNLFSGDPQSGVKSADKSSRISSKEVFDNISGQFISPRMYEDMGYWDKANVNLVLSNPSNQDAEFILVVHQYELSRSMYDVWMNTPQLAKFNYKYKIIEQPVNVKSQANEPVKFRAGSDTLWPAAIKLVAEKIRIAGEPPVKMAELTFYG